MVTTEPGMTDSAWLSANRVVSALRLSALPQNWIADPKNADYVALVYSLPFPFPLSPPRAVVVSLLSSVVTSG